MDTVKLHNALGEEIDEFFQKDFDLALKNLALRNESYSSMSFVEHNKDEIAMKVIKDGCILDINDRKVVLEEGMVFTNKAYFSLLYTISNEQDALDSESCNSNEGMSFG